MKDVLTPKQSAFIDYYLELGNATEAYKKAYDCKNDVTARTNANKNLQKPTIKAYIDQRRAQMDEERIAKPEEVLKYLTSVMRGEIKDQFDLDAPLQERTRAAEALAKRYRLYDAKDNKSLTDLEKQKEQLEIEYKKLQNEKLKAEIAKTTGTDEPQMESDGFIEALNGKTAEVWNNETEN
jgi:phage terminase small subunit